MTRGRVRAAGLLAAGLTGVMVLAACSSGSDSSAGGDVASTTSLAGSTWTLSSYASAAGANTAAVPGSDGAPLTFGSDGTIAGSTGCNRFSGAYTQDGANLTITLGPMTLMGCPDDVAAQESAVVAALPNVTSFTADGDLILKDGSGSALLTYAPGIADLAGTSWQATGINNGNEAVVSTAATSGVTAVFGDDGTLTGSGGCNTYSATYTSGSGEIAIGPVAATKKACPDEVMTMEQQYFAALAASTAYVIEGTTLTLRDAAGATQATFQLSP